MLGHIPYSLIDIPHYPVYRAEGVASPGYGGVGVYLHKNLTKSFSANTYCLDKPAIELPNNNLLLQLGPLRTMIVCLFI